MPQPAMKVRPRQAIAVFHDGRRLLGAIRTLEAAGVEASDLGIVAGRKAVEEHIRPLAGQADSDTLGSLLRMMHAVGDECRQGPLLVSKGPLGELLERVPDMPSPSGGRLLDRWLLPRHAETLHGQLDAGACLLFVRVRMGKEESRACNALLRHSDHPVQVHDLGDATEDSRRRSDR